MYKNLPTIQSNERPEEIAKKLFPYIEELFLDYKHIKGRATYDNSIGSLNYYKELTENFLQVFDKLSNTDKTQTIHCINNLFKGSKYTHFQEFGMDHLLFFCQQNLDDAFTEKVLTHISPTLHSCFENSTKISLPLLKYIFTNFPSSTEVDSKTVYSFRDPGKKSIIYTILSNNMSSSISDLPEEVQQKVWCEQNWEDYLSGAAKPSKYAPDRESTKKQMENMRMVMDAFHKYSTVPWPSAGFNLGIEYSTKEKYNFRLLETAINHGAKQKYSFTINIIEELKTFLKENHRYFAQTISGIEKTEKLEQWLGKIEEKLLKGGVSKIKSYKAKKL